MIIPIHTKKSSNEDNPFDMLSDLQKAQELKILLIQLIIDNTSGNIAAEKADMEKMEKLLKSLGHHQTK
jgi:hypothetical protein